MPYTATIVKVMIASPGDVADERQIIKEVIYEWDSINSESTHLALLPAAWESHASPMMGDRAQALINKQVLRSCDVLVAVFWTRLGSPTGDSPSGTVEEIREHVQQGKPAMIYFSQQPVRPDSVDDSQYKALREFRSECEAEGLIEVYDSLAEFREKFARQLAQTILREFPRPADSTLLSSQPRPHLQSSTDAATLLKEAVQDAFGAVIRSLTSEGLGIRTNDKYMAERGNPKSEAQWEAALQDLIRLELLQQSDRKGDVFKVTHEGYKTAERLAG